MHLEPVGGGVPSLVHPSLSNRAYRQGGKGTHPVAQIPDFFPPREHLLSVRRRVGVLPRRLDLPPVLTGEKGCLRKWVCWWYGSRGTATSILEQEENDGKTSFSNDGCISEKLLSFEFLLRGFFAAASIQKCCHLAVAIADNFRLRGVQPVKNISELR